MKKIIIIVFLMMPIMALCDNDIFGFKLGSTYNEVYKYLEDNYNPYTLDDNIKKGEGGFYVDATGTGT